ncbi:MAG: ribonuclease PH [Holosporales bacterium]|jgi:ribonuclease PH|nr:ribonuclease PH [Holosporales bacterium]
MTHAIRLKNRACDQLRTIALCPNYYPHCDGSCFVKFGNTHIICAATIEEKVPIFLRYSKTGWITAEYGLLPCSCQQRTDREAVKGKQTGRTLEIQRLIARSLRSVIDLSILGERQIKIDCDVIQADGGTRTASITGSFIALYLACQKLIRNRTIIENPIKENVAAVSCGMVNGSPLLDLDFSEDSIAEVDANFVMSGNNIIEIQSCGEKRPFTEKEFADMFSLARAGCTEIISKQNEILKG